MKLCVIGSGAAGLCAIKQGLCEFQCEVTAFEQTRNVGGIWVYTDEVGKDKNGLDVHSSMYQGLHSNSPKEVMGYPTVPFPEQDNSYITAEEVIKYYRVYAEKFDLRKYIKFEHHVLRVRPMVDESWEVIVQDMVTRNYETLFFDAVLVCNGHYNAPNMPKIRGQNIYEGRQLHAHDYRSADAFRNETVIIGAGPSGMDCVTHISKGNYLQAFLVYLHCYTYYIDFFHISKVSIAVTWSNHLGKQPITHFRENVNQKPDVKEITQSGASFVDGSYQDYSVIIYCTGYQYKFPFLSVDCGVKCENNYIRPLFKHCISINQPTLGLIGLPSYVCPNQMFDLQARFCLTFMTGRKELPSKDEMMRDFKDDMQARKERGIFKNRAHFIGVDIQEDYYADLARIADIEPIKPVISRMFKKGLSHFHNDSTDFRNDVFKVLDDENYVIVNKKK